MDFDSTDMGDISMGECHINNSITSLTTIAQKHMQKFNIESFFHDVRFQHSILSDYTSVLQHNDIVKSITIDSDKTYLQLRNYDIKIIIPFDNPNSFAYQIVILGKDVEYEHRMMIHQLARGKECIFDIGANIGWYSLFLSKLNPQSKVFAFEPIPDTYEQLCANVHLNKLYNTVTNQIALSDNSQVNVASEMYYDKMEPGAASFRNIRERDTVTKVSVPMTTVDAFCSEHDCIPEFIKIDVEGSELYVLRGAENVLKTHHPILFVEILRKWCAKFGHSAMDVVDYLKSIGYDMFILKNNELTLISEITEDTVDTNFYFLKG